MADDVTVVTSGSAPAEAASPSPADTTPAPPTTDRADSSAAPSTPDPYEQLKDHPELVKRIEAEATKRADALAQKRLQKMQRDQLRQTAARAAQSEDADTALEVARQIASQEDDDDPSPAASREAALRAEGFFNSKEYRAVFFERPDELGAQYGTLSPDQFKAWVQTTAKSFDDSREAEIDRRANEKAMALARGIATEQTNQALRNVPIPLSGGGAASGAVSHERYLSDPELRRKLKSTPEGRKQIDEMMARAASRAD